MNRTRRTKCITAGGWLLLVGGMGLAAVEGAQGQPGPLVGDRPDFTEATVTVGRGVVQIEFGYTLEYDRPGDEGGWAHSLGEPLLRAGLLADWLELRLGVSPVVERTGVDGGPGETGMEDLYLGLKLALMEQEGVRPAAALIPQMTLPTGSDAFTSDLTLPGVNLTYSWDVTGEVSLAGSTQLNRAAGGSGGGYPEWAQSLAAGLAVGARTGLYAEWYAFFHREPGDPRTEHYANGGLTRLLAEDFQWDIRAGVGLNESAADMYAGTGASLRIP